MKPKTLIQKEVHSLLGELPPLTEDQMDYAYEKMFKKHIYRTKHHSTCLECTHKWENDMKSPLANALLDDTCPSCGATLKPLPTPRVRTDMQDGYIGIATVIGGFQVFRYFYAKKNCKVGKKPMYWIAETTNHWISKEGKVVICSLLWNSFGWGGGERWQWTSQIEVRAGADKYYIYPQFWFPNLKLLKVIKRNGFSRSFHDFNPSWFCELILTKPKFETLVKAKQIAIWKGWSRNERYVNEYWPSIKIAIRHHYTITHPSDWFDHLRALEYLGMDILNPKLICLEDFTTEHQRIIDRRNRLEAKRRYEKEKKDLEQAEINYQKAKQAYLNLKFKQGELCIAPLKNVKEFYEEGESMHHCVTSYHKKEESLILSAKLNGQRLETVEVSLTDFTVAQSRGLQNKKSKHHKHIVKLVEQNIPKIKKASKTKTKKA